MKNKDDFVNKKNILTPTLEENIEYYSDLNAIIEGVRTVNDYYKDLLKKDDSKEKGLSFKDQYKIFELINKEALRSEDKYLIELKEKIRKLFPEVDNYINSQNKLRELVDEKNRAATEDISFDTFNIDYDSECIPNHTFVRLDGELKCICCGATTKDYDLDEKELDFLTECADKQEMLIKSATKEDLPLLQVLFERNAFNRGLYTISEDEELSEMNIEEEQYFAEVAEISELNRAVEKAHVLDAEERDQEDLIVENSKYFSEEQANELLIKIGKELEKLKESDSRFKNLMIEDCMTAKYEVLLLAGKHINTLLEMAKDEDERIALTKAYYNISNQVYRLNSDYFAPDYRSYDALKFDFVTANPDINNQVLEMKLRR